MCRQGSIPNIHRQCGAVMILLGLAIAMLIGFAGLAIDLGRFFVIKTELQNAVDACALSAASQLRPGQNNNQALIKAVAYGRVFSTGGTTSIDAIKNRANFQSTVTDITDITFSRTQTFPDAGVTFNNAAYVKCSYPLTGLPVYFMRVLDSTQQTATVSAFAVAKQGPSASVCAIPVGICSVGGGTPANNYGLTVGNWYAVKSGASTSGWFGWIDFTPPGGGASEAADLFTGSGQCALQAGTNVAQQGNIASLAVAWNSRFGWYKSGGGGTRRPPQQPRISLDLRILQAPHCTRAIGLRVRTLGPARHHSIPASKIFKLLAPLTRPIKPTCLTAFQAAAATLRQQQQITSPTGKTDDWLWPRFWIAPPHRR